MNRIFVTTVLMLLILPAAPAMAKVDWKAKPAVKTSQSPVDVTVSADGKRTFVLTKGNTVEIYDQQGKLEGTIPVDAGMNNIAVNGKGDQITVSSTKDNTIQEINIDYIFSFSIDGSPFLGNSAAPVVMAVFSDFQ